MAERNGGYAFPQWERARPDLGPDVVETFATGGMSLRDWFAGQVLMGLMAWRWENPQHEYYHQASPKPTEGFCGLAGRPS